MEIKTDKMTPIGQISSNSNDPRSLKKFSDEAVIFLESHNWCKNIKNGYLDFGIDGILGVFYFEIETNSVNADNFLWVIIGDLPPAYIAINDCPNGYCALDAYVGEMQEWIKAVKNGQSVGDLIPVNVEPNLKNASLLENRLNFIDSKILAKHKDKLK